MYIDIAPYQTFGIEDPIGLAPWLLGKPFYGQSSSTPPQIHLMSTYVSRTICLLPYCAIYEDCTVVTVLDYTCVLDLAVQLCARLPNFSLVA